MTNEPLRNDRADSAGDGGGGQPMPNHALEDLALREQSVMLSLLLKDKAILAKAMKAGLDKDWLWRGDGECAAHRALLAGIRRSWDTHRALLSRQAWQSMIEGETGVDEAVCRMRSAYDSVYAAEANPDDHAAVLDSIRARKIQQEAYGVFQDGFDRLLHARKGADRIVKELRDGMARALSEGRPSADMFPVLSLSDLEALQPDPADSLVGDLWLRRGGAVLLTGGTGIGKSVLAEQLAVSAAGGARFFGVPVPKPIRVLHVSAENDETFLKRDFLSIVRNHPGKPAPAAVNENLRVAHAYALSGRALEEWLEDRIGQWKPDMLVLDPYSAFLPGSVDINSTASFLGFRDSVERMLKEHRIGLLLVCHTPKPREREGWTGRQGVYMATGSSAISNWARAACELVEVEDGERFRLHFSKAAEQSGLADDDGNPIRDIYLEHSGDRKEPYWRLSADQGKPASGKYSTQIRAYRQANPEASQRAIADAVGCSPGAVNKALKGARGKG